jgi:hypothetical protein
MISREVLAQKIMICQLVVMMQGFRYITWLVAFITLYKVYVVGIEYL